MTIDWDEKKALLQEPNIAAVTQLCDELMEKKPGSVVPYIDPVHDEDECRIVSLHISPGKGTESGFVSHFNDDEAARRATRSTSSPNWTPLRDAVERLPVGPRPRASRRP